MMYRPSAYAVDDVVLLHEIMQERAFAVIAAALDGEVAFAYAPIVVDTQAGPKGTVRFHLARANPLASLEGAKVRIAFLGPDAYISPDWYGREGFVPTWNYIAIEGAGTTERLSAADLRELLVDLSAMHESRLLSKRPWTLDKLAEQKIQALEKMIVGFRVRLGALEGKFKLSQDKPGETFEGVVMALEARSDPASKAVAAAMRKFARTARE